MSKKTSTFNAIQDLNGPGSTKVGKKNQPASVTVTGNAAPATDVAETYFSKVTFTEPTGYGTQKVLWAIVRVSGTGLAYINQNGLADFSESISGDKYDISATSVDAHNNFADSVSVIHANPIDGGRGGGVNTGSTKAAVATGKLSVTVA